MDNTNKMIRHGSVNWKVFLPRSFSVALYEHNTIYVAARNAVPKTIAHERRNHVNKNKAMGNDKYKMEIMRSVSTVITVFVTIICLSKANI